MDISRRQMITALLEEANACNYEIWQCWTYTYPSHKLVLCGHDLEMEVVDYLVFKGLRYLRIPLYLDRTSFRLAEARGASFAHERAYAPATERDTASIYRIILRSRDRDYLIDCEDVVRYHIQQRIDDLDTSDQTQHP